MGTPEKLEDARERCLKVGDRVTQDGMMDGKNGRHGTIVEVDTIGQEGQVIPYCIVDWHDGDAPGPHYALFLKLVSAVDALGRLGE